MRRPLRSVLIGDISNYPSEFCFGAAQAMTLLGHFHRDLDVRQPIDVIDRMCEVIQPQVLWMHMMLWSPGGPSHTLALLELCERWRRRGAVVFLHDGDARLETRWPHDISAAVDLALCNHTADRSAWGIRQVRWPYFAFAQSERAPAVPEFTCDLAFAGRLGAGIYAERTELLGRCQAWLGDRFKLFPNAACAHTLFRTPELAASASAMLGFGRPDAPGWTDVRVFLLPGAGGVLLHDDVQGFLEPGVHYVLLPRRPEEGDLRAALRQATLEGPGIRARAFQYVQAEHSSVARVRQALQAVGLAP